MGAEALASRAESGVVHVAGPVQGRAPVTFPAAGTVFTDPDEAFGLAGLGCSALSLHPRPAA